MAKVDTGGLISSQRGALWRIWRAGGIDASHRIANINGVEHVVHASSVVVLVGRGLVAADKDRLGRIVCTRAGAALAKEIDPEMVR